MFGVPGVFHPELGSEGGKSRAIQVITGFRFESDWLKDNFAPIG